MFAFSLTLAFAAPGVITGARMPVLGQALYLTALAILGFLWVIGRGQKLKFRLRDRYNLALFGYIAAYLFAFLVSLSYDDPELKQASLYVLLFMLITILLSISLIASLSSQERNVLQALERSILWGMTSLCLLQFMMMSVGIRNAVELPQTANTAIYLSMLGIDIDRVSFPLATGFQSGAIAPFVLVCMSIVIWIRSRKSIYIATGALGSLMVLLADVRSYLLAALLSGILLTFLRHKPKIVATVAVVAPLVPLILIELARGPVPALIDLLSSRESYDMSLFTGREIIWNQVIEYTSEGDISKIFFGHGLFGQTSSGLVYSYNFIFYNWEIDTANRVSLHNSYVQIFIDTGLIGTFFYCAMAWIAVRRVTELSQNKKGYFWGSAALILISLQFSGGADVVLTPYARESFTVLMLIWAALAIEGRADRATHPRSRSHGRRRGFAYSLSRGK